MYAVM